MAVDLVSSRSRRTVLPNTEKKRSEGDTGGVFEMSWSLLSALRIGLRYHRPHTSRFPLNHVVPRYSLMILRSVKIFIEKQVKVFIEM